MPAFCYVGRPSLMPPIVMAPNRQVNTFVDNFFASTGPLDLLVADCNAMKE